MDRRIVCVRFFSSSAGNEARLLIVIDLRSLYITYLRILEITEHSRVFCGIIWGSISDRIGRSRGAALAYLVLGLSYIIFALIKVKFGFYLSAVMFGLTAWSIPTIMAAAAGDFFGPRLAPAGLGFITLFFGIGQALGPALGGYMADVSNSFTMPFLLAGGISFVGMVTSLYLKKPVLSTK